MRHFHRFIIIIFLFFLFSQLLLPASQVFAATDTKHAPIAICHNGKFIAEKDGDVLKWLGIPFAKPPVGKLRWKAPILAENSNNTYAPQGYGKMPLQAWQPLENTSENCLKLNIYTGADNRQNKPVIVFLQPSAFCYGGGNLPYCNAFNLVSAHPEIIFICIETRLGIMGSMVFDNVPGAENMTDDTAYLWLLDTRCALQWIQKNIKAFGGNPNNVTLFGVSAGATAATLMPLLPNTKGLFHRMIVASGTPAITGPSEGRANVTKKLMELTNAKNMSDLMELSEEQLSNSMPELDGIAQFETLGKGLTPQGVYEQYQAGATRGIPMLIGTSGNECAYFKAINHTDEKKFVQELQEKYKKILMRLPSNAQKIASQYISRYKKSSPFAYEALLTDTIFTVPACLLANVHSSHAPTYVYRFDFSSKHGASGAQHLAELPFVMNFIRRKNLPQNEKERIEQFTSTIIEMWINFAKTGIPSTDIYKWPQYTASNSNVLVFEKDGTIAVEKDPYAKECKLLAPLLPYTYIFAEEYFRFPEETYRKIFIRQ
ncbi:MAG: carboxylesterase family protein [Synergistaceae bacterium]|nr:carboxylesterase family protein [Synergistaceae bacterium]